MNTHLIANRGFTIVETLVSLVIMSIAIIALWPLHLAVIKNDDVSDKYSEATDIVNLKLEELKGMDFDSITVGTSSEILSPGLNRNYFVQSDITTLPGGATNQADIISCWKNSGQVPANLDDCDRTVSMTSFISDY